MGGREEEERKVCQCVCVYMLDLIQTQLIVLKRKMRQTHHPCTTAQFHFSSPHSSPGFHCTQKQSEDVSTGRSCGCEGGRCLLQGVL